MVRFYQIYKKAFAFYVLIIVLMVGLNSCVSRSTDLFLNTKINSSEDNILTKPVAVSIDKSCTYYFRVFSAGEYDKFDSNIYDQLRGSLFSEARYNYSDYDIHNLSQTEQGGFFKTIYRVEADLVLREVIRDKMNLIVNHKPISKVDPNSTKITSANNDNRTLTDSIEAGVQEKPLALKEELYSEEEKLVVLLDRVKLETTVSTEGEKSSIPNASKTENVQFQENEEKSTANVSSPLDTVAIKLTSAVETKNTGETLELKRTDLTEMTGKTVFIVACFQKPGFIEEKVYITEEEIGHPLKYYVTDKWIRVYLSDVRSASEAKSIYSESWPCRYGK